ncbi:hypothetical protein [Sebaldella sp. S0638]|uniref:hypothetical protein n=1 Tax=Sebaldella sp. S0638 TaxID=2957809 RepID=UPI0020A17132|nr:hypothetical protein [Sebaldella sp. S0638]MCP1226401.1 hypothetical protein [Sebaldella sp. S0638]
MKKILYIVFTFIIIIISLQVVTYLKLDLDYKERVEKLDEIEQVFNDYRSIIYLEYAPTLFDVSNRGGYERMTTLDNVFYKEAEVNLMRFKNKIVKINNKIYCQTEKDNINNRNECFNMFTQITMERLETLDKRILKGNIKEIKYTKNGQILWVLRVSKEHSYELELSENLIERLNSWYSLRISDKIYGKLTDEEYNAVFNIKNLSYNDKNYKEIEFLKKIIPFIEFSI